MNATLLARIARWLGFQSACIGRLSTESSAACIWPRYICIDARHDVSAGLSTYGITISDTAIVL